MFKGTQKVCLLEIYLPSDLDSHSYLARLLPLPFSKALIQDVNVSNTGKCKIFFRSAPSIAHRNSTLTESFYNLHCPKQELPATGNY